MLVNVRADLTYSQGLHKKWTRTTLPDYYYPVYAMLGEQAILNREIYCDGSANDTAAFGYIPRWDELRNFPSQITGLFRRAQPATSPTGTPARTSPPCRRSTISSSPTARTSCSSETSLQEQRRRTSNSSATSCSPAK